VSGINSTVRINDGMSPALKSMNKALNIVLNSFESLQAASGNSIDVADIVDARNELSNAAIAVSRLEDELKGAENAQENFTKEVNESESAMSGLVGKVAGLVAGYASLQTVMSAINLSDQITQTESRLNLIVDEESGESVDELTQKIMDSANRSRASYLDTASVVASFAQRAGDSFESNDEVIAFAETLNKMYVIAGASAEEQSSSMLQLTQALGSGVLRGEEFNAVFEAAPNIMQSVADYMNVPIGQLRDMAAEGQITADIVKNAIFASAESVNADFESMNMTWAQNMTLFKNQAIQAFDPVLRKINELANNKNVQNFVAGVGNALALVANFVLIIFELVASVGSFIYENWSLIEPLIIAAAVALGIYTGALIAYNAAQMISNGLQAIATMRETVHEAALAMSTGATFSATAAQYGFNAALLACPITWILLIIIAIIAAIYLIVAAINKVTGSTLSATGIIFGAISTAFAAIWNVILGFVSFFIGIGVNLYNLIGTFANFFANVFNDPVGAIVNLFAGLFDYILGIVEAAAEAIDLVLGTDLSSQVAAFRDDVDSAVADIVGEQTVVMEQASQEDVLATLGLSDFRIDYGDAWEAGYSAGESVDEALGNLSLDSLMNTASDTVAGLEDISGGIGDIAEDTGSISDNMEMSEEDLRYLRDIAEQETINRFTTAEIRIDMQNNNTIGSNMDIDGVVTQLEERLYESMEIAAEGAY